MTTFTDSALRFAVSTLLAGLWQAPLFAFAAWLVLRFAPRANATTRHSIFAAALVAALALPVATAVLATQTVPRHATLIADDTPLPRGARPTHVIRPVTPLPETIRRPDSEPPAPLLAVPALERFAVTLPAWLTLTIVALWIASAALVLGRLLVSLVHLESLKRDALPLDVAYRDGLARWSSIDKGPRNVRLCVSNEIEIPIAVGLFDAMILVPQRLMDELEPSEIDAIVLHELAHLRRGDDWFNALERVAVALLFFNPGILWLASQLDLEREVACDDWVLQQNDALPYASCLAKVAAAAAWPHRAAPAPGIFASRRGMSIRIERLLTKQRNVRVRTSLGVAPSAAALISTLGLGAALVSPSIAEETVPPPPAVVATTHVRAVEEHPRHNDEKRRHAAERNVT
ncbi:MAG: M56 family metallopeptidase, partial [Candidatus Eremiobacteraeota bacterium]|nr:M56 family metallopeptidase [Candidatus Eremiobacteraeota bacterium]